MTSSLEVATRGANVARVRSVTHPVRSLTLIVFFVATIFYVLTASGHIQTIDVNQSKAVSQEIVARGQVAISGFPITPAGGAVIGSGGHAYAEHDIGLALLFLPISAMLQWHWISLSSAEFLYSLVTPLFGAATVAIFFAFSCLITARIRVSLVAAGLFGITTILWPYAHNSFDVVPAGFFVLTSVFLLFAGPIRRRGSHGTILLAGVAAGAAVLVRVDCALIVAVESLVLVWLYRRSAPWRKLQVAAAWLAPLALAAAVALWYNHVRFGSWLNNGHSHDPLVAFTTPIWDGFAGQLFSPGKGIIFFAPPILIAIAGWWFMRRAQPVLTFLVGTSIVAYLLFHSPFADWSGADAWGPRFVVPVIGLMMLPLGLVLLRWRDLRIWSKTAVVILSAVGLLVQVIGVTTSYLGVDLMHPGGPWSSSQILNGWRVLREALRGMEPYSALQVKGVLPVPVPHFDLWWAGWGPQRGATGVVASVLLAQLVVVTVIGVALISRGSSPGAIDETAESRGERRQLAAASSADGRADSGRTVKAVAVARSKRLQPDKVD